MIVDGGRAFRCPRCGETKPRTTTFFYFDRRGNVNGYCRPCHRAFYRDRERSPTGAYGLARRRLQQRDWMRRRWGYDPARYRPSKYDSPAVGS